MSKRTLELEQRMTDATQKSIIYEDMFNSLLDDYESITGEKLRKMTDENVDANLFLEKLRNAMHSHRNFLENERYVSVGKPQVELQDRVAADVREYAGTLNDALSKLSGGEAYSEGTPATAVFKNAFETYDRLNVKRTTTAITDVLPPRQATDTIYNLKNSLAALHREAAAKLSGYLEQQKEKPGQEFLYALSAVSSFYGSMIATDEFNKEPIESLKRSAQEYATKHFQEATAQFQESLNDALAMKRDVPAYPLTTIAERLRTRITPVIHQYEEGMKMPFSYGRQIENDIKSLLAR